MRALLTIWVWLAVAAVVAGCYLLHPAAALIVGGAAMLAAAKIAGPEIVRPKE